MSVAVDIEALGERIAEYGGTAYLLTVTDDHVPHVVSVTVAMQGDRLITSVGRRTGANLAARPTATFLWPPGATGSGYSLIVDGLAVDPAGEGALHVEPTRAVLHRTAGASGDGPTCLPVESA